MSHLREKLLLVMLLVAAAPVSAGDLYFGAKTGKAMVDDPQIKSDPNNIGVMLGYEQGLVLGDLGAEVEYTTTADDGEYNNSKKLDFNTLAAYLAFRSAGPFYLKAKGGVLRIDINDTTDTAASYGVGIGLGLGITQLELEYTQTSFDQDLAYVSLGIQF